MRYSYPDENERYKQQVLHPMAEVIIDEDDHVIVHPPRGVQHSPTTQEEKKYKGMSGRLFVDALAATAILLAVLFGLLAGVGVFDKNSAQEDESRNAPPTPVAIPVSAPVATPVASPTTDCTFATLDINDDGQIVVRQYIDLSAQTVTVEMEYAGNAWLGFAFSEQSGMIPNIAAIGLPDEQTVLKYDLVSKNPDDIQPMDAARQTLINTSIVQADGTTILTFSKSLADDDEVSAKVTGSTRFNWAVGDGNSLGVHSPLFGSRELTFTTCGAIETEAPEESVAPEDTTPPTTSPVSQIVPETPSFSPSAPSAELDCSFVGAINLIEDGSLTLRQVINPVEQTVSVELEYFGVGWLGFAFSETDQMLPNIAVLGLPNGPAVLKYNLKGKALDSVLPLEDELQTLIEASIEQTEESTLLKFTRKLIDSNEPNVEVGENRFNWAVGVDNELATHLKRGSKVAIFDECRVVNPPADEETLEPSDTLSPSWNPVGGDETCSPTWTPTAPYLDATLPPSWSPSAWPTESKQVYSPTTARPTYLRTGSPTYGPTSKPIANPTYAPTYKPTANPTWSPSAQYVDDAPSGSWSKRGNRRACSRTVCPSAPWTGGQYADNGSMCRNGKDANYWEVPSPTTYEYFSDVAIVPTDVDGLWKLEATGKELALGWGGDSASESECFDDALRGGFRIDLSGDTSGFVFDESAKVTVTGWSPVMRMVADGQLVEEWRGVSGQAGEHIMWVPWGTKVLEVDCGGWPAQCSSDLWVAKPVFSQPSNPGY